MYITTVHKYKKDGVVFVGKLPDGIEPIEAMTILNATDGFVLIRKSDNENFGSNVWLKDGDSQDNYIEEEHKEVEPEEVLE
jgi:hypothetical protein